MLYDRRLDTFAACARSGSFSRAAEGLYMTPTAVMKQIRQLESNLDLALFEWTHRGLTLTAAGQQLLKETERLRDWSDQAEARIRQAGEQEQALIRIGTSPLTPPSLLADLWPKIQPLMPRTSFRLVPFDNKPEVGKQILANLGEEIDVVAGFFDDRLLSLRSCRGLALCRTQFSIGVPFGHPLWGRQVLEPEDLAGQTLLMIESGWSDGSDRLRQDLQVHIPDLPLESFPYFRSEELSRSVNEGKLILAFDIWKNVHPLLKVVPMHWDHGISYGFLYGREPAAIVRTFLDNVQRVRPEVGDTA